MHTAPRSVHRFARRALLAAFPLAFAALFVSAARPRPQEEGDTLSKLSYPRTIVLVRHAEKGVEPAADPNLSEKGAERAQRLSAMFSKSGVTHLYASEFQRAQQTLAPLAVASKVNVQIVSAKQPEAQLSALDSLPRGSLAIVSGHSNTVPFLLDKLTGGQTKVTIDEATEFDRIFVVTQWGPAKQSRTIELRY